MILTLKWQHPEPAKLSNFEEQARDLRYRALAHACADHKSDVLMTAHHLDDQAEGILMGLKDRETGLFIRSIKKRAPIPESSGIYGVDFSGVLARREVKWRATARNENANAKMKFWHSPDWTQVVEYGKVALIRPFLSLEKTTMIDICRSAVISWEDDATNTDVTVTPRNAIRNLLQENRLPLALRNGSLYGVNKRKQKRHDLACSIFRFAEHCCEIITFDIRSGMLKVRFVQEFFTTMASHLNSDMLKYTAAGVLETFLSPVSSYPSVKYESLEGAAVACFPDLPEAIMNPDQPEKAASCLTTCGVLLRRSYEPHQTPKGNEDTSLPLDKDHVWTMSREPSWNIPQLEFPNQDRPLTRRHDRLRVTRFSEWQLWDGRYWIQIQNRTRANLMVRALQKADITEIKAFLSETQFKDFHSHLNVVAPGKIRFTLPVLVKAPASETGHEEVIALPSLGKKGDFPVNRNLGTKDIDWRIRYKHFSLRANGLHTKFMCTPLANVSPKYDETAFKSWLKDGFLEGTQIARRAESMQRPHSPPAVSRKLSNLTQRRILQNSLTRNWQNRRTAVKFVQRRRFDAKRSS